METQAIDIEDELPPLTQEEIDNPDKDFKLQRSVPLFSFCDPAKYEQEVVAPLPKYLSNEEVNKPLPTEKADVLKDYKEIADGGGIVCINKEAMDKQKGVLVEVLKQLAVNIMKGQAISQISLPVKMFEPRSALHRISDLFSYAP